MNSRDRVLDRDEVAAVLAMGLFDVRSGLVECRGQSSTSLRELDLESQDLLDALEVDALVGQLLDSSQRRQVRVGESP